MNFIELSHEFLLIYLVFLNDKYEILPISVTFQKKNIKNGKIVFFIHKSCNKLKKLLNVSCILILSQTLLYTYKS